MTKNKGPQVDANSRMFAQPRNSELADRRFDAKLKGLALGLSQANANVEEHRVLILVDLQGMYLALHEWLSSRTFPLNDGFVLSRFAYFQIRKTFDEVSRRFASIKGKKHQYLKDVFDQIKLNEHDGKFFLAEEVKFMKDAVYLNLVPSFEIFYAPAPLRELEWKLRKLASQGDFASKNQLNKVISGIIEKPGAFERDYSLYDNFVRDLQSVIENNGLHRGFFNFDVRKGGLKYFDEKEVDTKIVMRTMDAFFKKEAESICIISSDQDFLPLHKRAKSEGVEFFQADLAKFRQNYRVGRRLRDMGNHFIEGTLDPSWPLEIITEAMSYEPVGHTAKYDLHEEEINSLCDMHNEMNDVKVQVELGEDGSASVTLRRPPHKPGNDQT